jgi:glycosyltransferase involved in cell wall biosynthesis
VKRFFALSATVAARIGYFPQEATVQVLNSPSPLSGFKNLGARYLFTVARLDPAKRIDLIIKSMLLARTRLPLKIAGTGPEKERLIQLARGDKRIEFLGFVRDDELVELYGGSLAVVYVPYEEDYGLVTIEAMMSRKPVITCVDSGGPLEFVRDSETGLIASCDPKDIGAKIDLLAADPDRARNMGEKGYERVHHISWQHTTNMLCQGLTESSSSPFFSKIGIVAAPRDFSSYSANRKTRPKVTVAVPFPIYPPLGGGQLRVFSLFRHVARDLDVELVTLDGNGTEFFAGDIASGMKEVRITKSVRHREEEASLARQAGGVSIGDIATTLLLEHTPEYLEQLARSMRTADVVVASHPYFVPAIRKFLERQLLVYEAQDVEAILKKAVLNKSGPVGAHLAGVAREIEQEACRYSSLILCCSETDAAELRGLYDVDPSRIVIAPNGVEISTAHFTHPALKDRLKLEYGISGQQIVLFVGSSHPPNLAAAEALCGIARELPNVKFLIVGSQCLPLSERPRPKNVGLMGVVDDDTLASLLSLADVALNPMLSGSGTNLKIATYLAAGVPVITTACGARGYRLVDGEHALICPIEGFARRVVELLSDKVLAERLAVHGRRLAEEHYDWKAIASKVTSALALCLGWKAGAPEFSRSD